MKPNEVLATPAYLGMILLGAISPDHSHLSMDKQDMARYPDMSKWKRQREARERNLNA